MQTTDNRHIVSAMSNTPEISVCMPMHNAARYLRLLLLCFLVCPFFAGAQQSFTVRITVYDEFMHEEMDADSLLVTVMEADSTIVKKDITFNVFTGLWFKKRPLLVNFHQEGFESQTISIPTPGKRIDYLNLKPIVMKRLTHRREHILDEVVVTASTVKMVNRGDTIVYNADAFQLSQGSMLDELVRALPNVELRKGGRIYVNGRFVESLLLNGKDFFKGNPTVALSNLPSYTVKEVKVYEQAKGMSRFDPTEKKPLVMDVNLKKEFMHGWIANAEAGYGTSNRYLGRLFALLFTPQSRLTIYGNGNNINDQTTPDEDEQWNPDWLSEGRLRNILGGIDHSAYDKFDRWEANTSADVAYESQNLKKESTSALYAENENLNRTESLLNNNKRLTANLYHTFSYNADRMSFRVDPHLKYVRSDNNSESVAEMFNFSNLLNFNNQTNKSLTNSLEGDMSISCSYNIPNTPDNLGIEVRGSFLKTKTEQNGELNIDYSDDPLLNTDRIYRQSDPTTKWNITSIMSYYARFFIKGSTAYTSKLWLKYIFSHNSDSNNRDYFQSDVLDNLNTYDAKEINNTHSLAILFSQSLGRGRYIRTNTFVRYTSRHLDYYRFSQPYFIERKNVYADPEIEFDCKAFNLNYRLTNELPRLYYLLDITDAINPLYVTRGNSSLSTALTHRIDFTPKFIQNWLHSDTRPQIRFSYQYIQDAVGFATSYDNVTGITTSRPINLSDNWIVSGNINMGYYLDKHRRFLLTNNTDYTFRNSTEMVNDRLNTVKNSMLTEKLSLSWSSSFGVQFKAFGSLEWRNVDATANPFNSNIFNYDYGITVSAPNLSWNISVKTDFAIHSRRGYRELDDDTAIWNIRISKSFLNGNLVAMIDGYDLLGQLSNVVVDLTPQGRTEARYNTLPRYAMLHVIYRLNIQPKKR